MFDGDVGFLADFDFFLQGFERFIRFISDVRHVEGAGEFCGGCGHGDDFVGGGVAADLIFEAGGKADGAFLHGLRDELGHLFDFGGSGDALEVFGENLFADGGVADHDGDVERWRDFCGGCRSTGRWARGNRRPRRVRGW